MTAVVVPFPTARRLAFIERQANMVAGLKADSGQRYIQRQIETQVAAMRRKGISDELIDRECRAMLGAIDALLAEWFHPDQTGGAI